MAIFQDHTNHSHLSCFYQLQDIGISHVSNECANILSSMPAVMPLRLAYEKTSESIVITDGSIMNFETYEGSAFAAISIIPGRP